MKLTVMVPVEVEIKDPVAALDAFVEDWGDDLENKDEIGPVDLILHAGRRDDLQVTVSDAVYDVDWLHQNGHPEEDEMITREELQEEM